MRWVLPFLFLAGPALGQYYQAVVSLPANATNGWQTGVYDKGNNNKYLAGGFYPKSSFNFTYAGGSTTLEIDESEPSTPVKIASLAFDPKQWAVSTNPATPVIVDFTDASQITNSITPPAPAQPAPSPITMTWIPSTNGLTKYIMVIQPAGSIQSRLYSCSSNSAVFDRGCWPAGISYWYMAQNGDLANSNPQFLPVSGYLEFLTTPQVNVVSGVTNSIISFSSDLGQSWAIVGTNSITVPTSRLQCGFFKGLDLTIRQLNSIQIITNDN